MMSDWRNDPGLSSRTEYQRSFALWQTNCYNNEKVWFKFYYKKYKHWSHFDSALAGKTDIGLHTDFIENVTEAEYIIRKLAENL